MLRTIFLIAIGFVAHAVFEGLTILWGRPAVSKALALVYLLAICTIVARLALCIGGCDS